MRRHEVVVILALVVVAGCVRANRSVTHVTTRGPHVRTLKLAWAYEGGPAPELDVRTLDLLPGHLVLCGTDIRGDVWVVSADTGDLLWYLDLRGRQMGTPTSLAGNGGRLYTIGSPDYENLRYVWALDQSSGRLARQLPLQRGSDQVAWHFDDGWLFVSDRTGLSLLTAVDLAAWRVAWDWRPDHPPFGINLDDVAAGKRLVALLIETEEERHPRVYLLDRASGRLSRTIAARADQDHLVRTGSVIYLPDTEGRTIQALSLDTGEELWRFSIPDHEKLRALASFGDAHAGRLLIQTEGPKPRVDRVHFLTAGGKRLWTKSGSMGMDSRSFRDGVMVRLYDGKKGGGILALSEDTGRLLWRHALTELAPELGAGYISVRFVPGAYGAPVLLQLHDDAQKGVVFAALDAGSGGTMARYRSRVDSADLLAVSDGQKLYLFEYGDRRLVALHLSRDRP